MSTNESYKSTNFYIYEKVLFMLAILYNNKLNLDNINKFSNKLVYCFIKKLKIILLIHAFLITYLFYKFIIC